MKTIFATVMAFASLFSSCSIDETCAQSESLTDKKALIVYLSRTKNTEAVADIIHQNTGGTGVALETEMPYPENYNAVVEQVRQENESGYLPPLKTVIDSIERYDVVFVGFPTWGMQLPPPMKSF